MWKFMENLEFLKEFIDTRLVVITKHNTFLKYNIPAEKNANYL